MFEKSTMRKWKENFDFLCHDRLYVATLSLTAVSCYGFLITHQTVGIDDTPYTLYFEEGLNAIVGRWFLFLLNKLFSIAEFSPFITDLAGVLILMAGVTVWGILLHSICGNRVPKWGYVFFSCIFLSCPLISEVYPYYLHNGISVGYLCTGISLCFFRELSEGGGGWKRRLAVTGGTAVFLFVALGCYESFMIVWLSGVFLVLLTEKYMGLSCRVMPLLGAGALAAVAAMILRSVMIAGVIGIFDLGYLRETAVQRSVTELAGWIFEPGAFAEFAMAVKRFYVMYFAFGYAYYPIKIFVTAIILMTLYGIYAAVRRRCGQILLLTLGSLVSCFLLVPVEGSVTLYRSAQFVPVICGYGAFLAACAVGGLKRRTGLWVLAGHSGEGLRHLEYSVGKSMTFVSFFALCVILWNQCNEMNKWFYVDWMKYQAALNTAEQIAAELKRGYDPDKPVVFTGTYLPPEGIIGDAYVSYGSETFFKIKRLTDPVDEHLLEKFYREYGVWVAQTPALSVLDWGINAFGTDEELARFFAMHGHDIRANTNPEYFEEAAEYSVGMPSFPAEGSVTETEKYVIVHF